MRKYTDEDLINELHRFVKENNRTPTQNDLSKDKTYPGYKTYKKYFGSWNNALVVASLPINRLSKLTGEEVCEKCGVVGVKQYRYKNGQRLCGLCYQHDRNHIHGVLDPNSSAAIGVITEHVVYEVLGDCIKCNTKDNFNSDYDLISEEYGTINVKSSKLCKRGKRKSGEWYFEKKRNAAIPNYYVCIGFDENRCKILKVWIIPGFSNVIGICGIHITNSIKSLNRVNQYEVMSILYNDRYINLNIYNLSEFKNVKHEVMI